MTPRNDGLQEGVLPRRHLPQHVQDLPHRRTAQVSLTQGLGLVGGVSPLWLYISEMRLIVNISVHRPKIFDPHRRAAQIRRSPSWGQGRGGGLVLPHRLDGPLGGHDIGGAWGFSSSRLYINRMLKARCTFFWEGGGGMMRGFPLPLTVFPDPMKGTV